MRDNLVILITKIRQFFSLPFLLIIISYLVIQIPFLTNMRPVICDEPWYANSGYNFMNGDGFINTIVGSGGNANFILPFFIAISFKLFGVSIFSARIVAVIAGLILLLGVRRLFGLLKIEEKRQILAFSVIVITSIFVSLFRYARPECLSVTFLLLSIIPFIKYYLTKDLKQIVFVSLFIMISFLSHPFTGVFFMIYGIYLLLELYHTKNLKILKYIFLLGFFGLLSFFLMSLANMYYNKLSFSSITDRTTLITSTTTIKDRFILLITYYFFTSRIIFTLPFILLLFHGLFIKKRIASIFSVFGISYLFIALLIFNELGMTTYIFNYSILFSVLIIPFSLEYFERIVSFKQISLLFFLFYFPLNLAATAINNYQKYERINSQLEDEIPKWIPKNTRVFGPIEFWFSLPETKYISHFYRPQMSQEFLNEFEYVIVKENDHLDIQNTYGLMITDTTKFSEIYSIMNTKSYGNIVLYKKR